VTPPGQPAVGLVAALRREVAALLAGLQGRRRERSGGVVICTGTLRGVKVALAVTGMGERRARLGTQLLLARQRPSAVLSLGFAGALVMELPAGSLVVPERLRLELRPESREPDPELRGRVLAAVQEAGLRPRGGASVTAASMVSAPEARAALGRRCGADVVDMEGYWVAREAAAAGIPFVSVRAVSDALTDHHPVLAAAVGSGGVDPLKLLGGFAGNPREVAKLPRLMLGARAAAGTLESAVLASLPSLTPEVAA